MSQPVRLSDEIMADARLASDVLDRSIAGQIEHWASGSINGKPLAVHSNHVQPYERIRQLFIDLLKKEGLL